MTGSDRDMSDPRRASIADVLPSRQPRALRGLWWVLAVPAIGIGVYAFGPRVYSGTGGQLAFHLGAFLSQQGRAVTVLPSTARGGEVSTIVPRFEPGQIVSIPRELADTIVTDQGVARLLGKSVRERAEELITAAHPDHRDWLREEARRLYHP